MNLKKILFILISIMIIGGLFILLKYLFQSFLIIIPLVIVTGVLKVGYDHCRDEGLF